MGQPTRHELLREHFVAKLAGPYTTGPGRFTDQALQGFILGSGGSNQSLRLFLQMRFFVPIDGAQPTTGLAVLLDKTSSTTGNALVLDLTSTPGSGSNSLPGHFTWTVDPASGGLYSTAGGFGMGQGTLDVHYAPSNKASRKGIGTGNSYVVINGLINTAGGLTDVTMLGNRPNGS